MAASLFAGGRKQPRGTRRQQPESLSNGPAVLLLTKILKMIALVQKKNLLRNILIPLSRSSSTVCSAPGP